MTAAPNYVIEFSDEQQESGWAVTTSCRHSGSRRFTPAVVRDSYLSGRSASRPAGGDDILARLLAETMQETFGKSSAEPVRI